MAEELKKAMCFVKEKLRISRESMPTDMREREDHIDLCQEIGFPMFFIPVSTFDEPTEENIQVVTYTKLGSLPGKIPVPVESLEGYNVFLRSWTHQTHLALRAISKLGGKNEVTQEDLNVVYNWPFYVSQDYIKRPIAMLKASELEQMTQEYALDDNIFIKAKEKVRDGHGLVTNVAETLEALSKGLPYHSRITGKKEVAEIKPETEIIISQPISFRQDERGNIEYRTWIFNNNVVAITRYGFPNDLQVPEEVSRFAGDFSQAHSGKIPKHYVVDIGITPNLGCVVVELNDIMSAGNLSKDVFRRILEIYIKSN